MDKGDIDPRLKCQCKRWNPLACHNQATQEDFFCDGCRDGCSLYECHDPSNRQHAHLGSGEFVSDLRLVPEQPPRALPGGYSMFLSAQRR